MRDVFTSPLQDCVTRDRGANRCERSLILFAAAVVYDNVRNQVKFRPYDDRTHGWARRSCAADSLQAHRKASS
jgi:hypothetical protein